MLRNNQYQSEVASLLLCNCKMQQNKNKKICITKANMQRSDKTIIFCILLSTKYFRYVQKNQQTSTAFYHCVSVQYKLSFQTSAPIFCFSYSGFASFMSSQQDHYYFFLVRTTFDRIIKVKYESIDLQYRPIDRFGLTLHQSKKVLV